MLIMGMCFVVCLFIGAISMYFYLEINGKGRYGHGLTRLERKRQDALMNIGNRIANVVRKEFSWATATSVPLGASCQVTVKDGGELALLLGISQSDNQVVMSFRSRNFRKQKTYTTEEASLVTAIQDVIKFLRWPLFSSQPTPRWVSAVFFIHMYVKYML